MPIFIGVAGGTGAGKSSLCTSLMDKYPERIGMIQLDDYFKPEDEVPEYAGHKNWDHPDALYLDKLANDLHELAQGKTIIANTKNDRLNPEFVKTGKRIPAEFHPKPIMLVEGYLVLAKEEIRDLLTTSIWLDVDHDTRWERRVHFKNDDYEQNVLLPNYVQHAEPTKQYADHIIDVTGLSQQDVLLEGEAILATI